MNSNLRLARSILALASPMVALVLTACGGGGATCTGCTYGSGRVTVNATDLEGGRLTGAKLQTSVKHDTCPYDGAPSPCTARLTIDVGCIVRAADTYQFDQRPNGYSETSSGNAKLVLELTRRDGSTFTRSLPLTMTGSNLTTDTWPCGGQHAPSVQ